MYVIRAWYFFSGKWKMWIVFDLFCSLSLQCRFPCLTFPSHPNRSRSIHPFLHLTVVISVNSWWLQKCVCIERNVILWVEARERLCVCAQQPHSITSFAVKICGLTKFAYNIQHEHRPKQQQQQQDNSTRAVTWADNSG